MQPQAKIGCLGFKFIDYWSGKLKKIFLILIIFFCLISCTVDDDSTDTTDYSEIDSSGYTFYTCCGCFIFKWRVVDDTYLEGILMGDPGNEGWIAIGFGQNKMSGAKIIVAQNGSDIDNVLDATGYNYGLNSNSTTILSSSDISVDGTSITATFNVNLSDVGVTVGESSGVIWAYKSISRDAKSVSQLGYHGNRGSTSILFQ